MTVVPYYVPYNCHDCHDCLPVCLCTVRRSVHQLLSSKGKHGDFGLHLTGLVLSMQTERTSKLSLTLTLIPDHDDRLKGDDIDG